MKKTLISSALLLGMLIIPLASCTSTPSTQNSTPNTTSSIQPNSSSSIESPYTIKITPIGSSTIQVSKTVTLRTTVTGTTQKDVIWSSLNEDIAAVTDRGVVTGLKVGTATIKATLSIDSNCSATFVVNVDDALSPTAITIKGFTSTTGWVGEYLNLSVDVLPIEAAATVRWSSSDEFIATVGEDGKVSFLKEGAVKISAVSTVDSKVSDEVGFTVRKGVFLTDKGSSKWDYSAQDSAIDPHILLSKETDDISAGFNSAYFAHFKGQYFYAEASFKCLGLTSNSWDWQGFGLGSGLNDEDARFFTYSPHSPVSANSFNKIILRDRPETWGALTTRSQIWGEHNLNDFSLEDEIKISMIRYENEYYYLLNDEVYYYDQNTKYDGIDTIPFVVSYDLPVKVSKYSLVTGKETIGKMIEGSEYKKSFFASYSNVQYIDDSDFTFTSLTESSKNHKVRSIGDKAKIFGDFDIEFDVDSMVFNSEVSSHTGLAVNFSRYDSADVVDTISLGRSTNQNNDGAIIGRYTRWDYTQDFSSSQAIKEWFETTEIVKADSQSKSHVKISRTIDGDYAYYHLFVDGVEYNFDLSSKGEGARFRSTYTGAYLIWVAGEYSTSHVSNFVINSNI